MADELTEEQKAERLREQKRAWAEKKRRERGVKKRGPKPRCGTVRGVEAHWRAGTKPGECETCGPFMDTETYKRAKRDKAKKHRRAKGVKPAKRSKYDKGGPEGETREERQKRINRAKAKAHAKKGGSGGA